MCISVDDTIKEAEARIAQFLDQRYRCHEIMKPYAQEAAWSVLAGRGTPGQCRESAYIFRHRVLSVFFLFIFSYLLIAAMVLLVSWQIDQCYFPVSLTCISGGIREEPVNPEVIGHRSDEIEMATGLVEHRSRTD